MNNALKTEIEEYVSDWHWDEQSKAYAFDLGRFLFAFMNYVDDLDMSERSKKKHNDNTYLIGMFEAQYGYQDEFFYEDLAHGPACEYEFKRKVSDSKYAVQSYESTWRKLGQFIESGTFRGYTEKINRQLEKTN